ncbi:MAG: hypothetical protein WD733_04200 [Bryobacterales bacterium]
MELSARRTPSAEKSTLAVDWQRCVALAKQGAAQGVKAWFAASEVRGGNVNGAVGHLTPGSLQSRGFFRQSMWTVMAAGGLHDLISAAFADAVWESWQAWFAGYEIMLDYPSLAAVECAMAPLAANKPLQFSAGKSSAHDRMSSAQLAAVIEKKLLSLAAEPGAYEACCQVSDWLSACFSRWHSTVLLMKVMASGPVPSYAPPHTMCGPVVGGVLSSPRPVLADLGLFDPEK